MAASLLGLDAHVVEKQALVGGSSAYSYGTLWVPCSPAAAREGLADDPQSALTYLRHEMGAQFDEARARAYLAHAPRMLEFFERHAGLHFHCRENFPDHHPDKPGASLGGRTIFVAPFDGRELGALIRQLRPPLRTQTLMGMMYTPKEVKILQKATRSWASFRHTARRLLRHWADLARHGRTMWLTNGNALVARLLKASTGLGIPVWTSSPMRRLLVEDGRVCGAVIERDGQLVTMRARRGVVLACGGFGWSGEWCSELLDRPALDGANWSLATPGNTGDGLRAALESGARIDDHLQTPAFWAPVSRPPGPGAELAGHFHDRHRPGFLAVDARGRRFADEALSNHHFAEAIVRAAPEGQAPVAYLICDHQSLRRVGCGDLIAPWPARLAPHLRSGYLQRADSIAELAPRIGIDSQALEATVGEFNQYAREGRDPLFGKGESPFARYYGDPAHRPNPCIGPLGKPPYYAVRLTAGHMGTLVGLKTDIAGRALGHDDRPIPGLYAVGNDMANVFGGACPGGGITLGPGMTFAHLAAQHMAGQPIEGLADTPCDQEALAA